jgi:hypothetical protein
MTQRWRNGVMTDLRIGRQAVQPFFARWGRRRRAGGIAPSYSVVADYFPPEPGPMLAIYCSAFRSAAQSASFGGVIATVLDFVRRS